MSAIEPLLQDPVAQAIGWALIHFIWQGALIGLLAALALAALRRSAADVRYVVGAIALSLMATMPIVTGVQTWRTVTAARADAGPVGQPLASPGAVALNDSQAPGGSSLASGGSGGTRVSEPEPAASGATGAWRITRPAGIEPWLPVFVLTWLVGVVLLTLRLLGGWLWVQRMKAHAANAAAHELQVMVERLSRRLHISRNVRLLQSPGVDVPTVIGWIKPVILLPMSALAGLSSSQIEAILAHELAHIRRHDYLVNLLQTLLETLLFYHPAVWWLSRRIRAERENCCDDLAVSLCGDPVAYARALADLEERRGAPVHLALAATGGPLLHRVRRLLLAAPASHAGRGPVWLAGATAVVLMTGIALAAVSREETASAKEVAQWPTPPPPPAAPALPPVPATPASNVAPAIPESPAVPAAPAAESLPPAPAAPAVPAAPSQPSLQTQPAVPSQPSRPSEPPVPSQPSQPSQPSVPSVPSQPSQPSVPSQPSAPSAPSAPAGISGHFSSSTSSGQSSGNFTWSNNGEKLEVSYRGDFEFTDDDLDVKRISPGGYLKISDGGWLRGKSVEFRADESGTISRRYWNGSSERPFDSEGRQWLSQSLPRFIRQTGLGAKSRVARFLKNGGPAAVLAEISKIEGSWAKRLYFTELLATASLDQATATRVLEQAGREIDSDYELASLLIGTGERLITSDATRKAYFDAARTIQSDYEMRRVYSAALKRGPVNNQILGSMLEASRGIESDYELAELLAQIAKLQSIDGARAAFFAALATIDSDYEQGKVLSALSQRTDLSAETTGSMLQSVAAMSSDYETASFLLRVAKGPVEGAARAPFFAAVESVDSSYERSRVLQAVLRRTDLSQDSLLAVLRAMRTMSSGYEMSQVLQLMARNYSLTGQLREQYVEVAGRLGDYEQTQALAALVRSEKRR